MRKLTIKRKKQIVAMAAKVRVGIKTEDMPELKLTDANLKICGVLKRGEELVIEIPEEETEIFVVFDKLMPDKFHAKYVIEAGTEDVVLYTQATFNPFKGNPFVISKDELLTIEDKQRMRTDDKNKNTSTTTRVIYWIIIIVSVIVGFFVGGMLAG